MSRARNVAIPSTADYRQLLSLAWQDAFTSRTDDAPTVVSLFAGGGGSSLGYRMAGYRELLATDWDARAVETLGMNLPDVPTWQPMRGTGSSNSTSGSSRHSSHAPS